MAPVNHPTPLYGNSSTVTGGIPEVATAKLRHVTKVGRSLLPRTQATDAYAHTLYLYLLNSWDAIGLALRNVSV